jgi:magnesium-transporting ATPase (P-type)
MNNFSIRRLALLLRRDFSSGYKSVIIAMAAVGGFVILVSIVSAFGRELGPMHKTIYYPLLFLGGYIVTSLGFKELHLDAQSVFYLTLPGSSLEKFLSKLLVTSVGYAFGSLFFYTAVSSAAEGINRLVFGYGHPFFNPFERTTMIVVAVYLVTQAVFLVGSVYFRKLAFVKTNLYIWLFGLVVVILVAVIGWFIFRNYSIGNRIGLEPYFQQLGESGELQTFPGPLAEKFAQVAKVLFWAVMAPVCWVISYLRLRETEV